MTKPPPLPLLLVLLPLLLVALLLLPLLVVALLLLPLLVLAPLLLPLLVVALLLLPLAPLLLLPPSSETTLLLPLLQAEATARAASASPCETNTLCDPRRRLMVLFSQIRCGRKTKRTLRVPRPAR